MRRYLPWELLVVITILGLALYFAVRAPGAPVPARVRPAPAFSFIGEWEIDWDGVNGTMRIRSDGTHKGLWGRSRWIGAWKQTGTRISFLEGCPDDTNHVNSYLTWEADMEVHRDGKLAGHFLWHGARRPITMKRVVGSRR
jgi:hypothetical protein